MKILVLMKQVPDLVEELMVDATGQALDRDGLKLKANEFDEHALEEALLLKESGGGEVSVLALDGEEVDKMLHTALARGADRAMKVTGAGAVAGNLALARLFVEVIGDATYDLILTGVQAADDLDGQLGPTVAALLERPCVEVVTHVTPENGHLLVHKEYSGGVVAELEVDLPAVLGIQAARQTPRYVPISRLRQVQQSAEIATRTSAGAAAGSGVRVVVMTPPETGGGAQMLGGIDELYAMLESKGVLP